MFRKLGDRTMEAWTLHMLGGALLRRGRRGGARRAICAGPPALPRGERCRGLTLSLDDLSSLAIAEATSIEPPGLRGAARNLTDETGAGLAGVRDEAVRAGARPGVRRTCPTGGSRALRRRGRGDDARRDRRLRPSTLPVRDAARRGATRRSPAMTLAAPPTDAHSALAAREPSGIPKNPGRRELGMKATLLFPSREIVEQFYVPLIYTACRTCYSELTPEEIFRGRSPAISTRRRCSG